MSWSLHVCFRHQSLQFNLLYLLFSLCRRYYKEEEELVLDVGPFAKALEVLKTMNNVVYIYSYTLYMYKTYKGSAFRVVKLDFSGTYNFNP